MQSFLALAVFTLWRAKRRNKNAQPAAMATQKTPTSKPLSRAYKSSIKRQSAEPTSLWTVCASSNSHKIFSSASSFIHFGAAKFSSSFIFSLPLRGQIYAEIFKFKRKFGPRTSNFAFDTPKFEQNSALKFAVKTLNLSAKLGRSKFKHAKAASLNFPAIFCFYSSCRLR